MGTKSEMFCNQCEQTSRGIACTYFSTCGKPSKTANFQDIITGSLINLAKLGEEIPDKLLLEAMYATCTNVNFSNDALEKIIARLDQPFSKYYSFNYGDEDAGSLRVFLMVGMRGVAAYAYHALVLGFNVSGITEFIRRGLAGIARERNGVKQLLPLVMECGKVSLDALELLDQANTTKFGDPAPVTVSRTIEPGPFIVVSGHDLNDLKLLLEQSEGKGVNVYTNGEMLPAHAYPELKKYAHLKGNFGTVWYKQSQEFTGVPAAFLFTTNCLHKPDEKFSEKLITGFLPGIRPGEEFQECVFTTAAVGYPGVTHIDDDKDFSPVIAKAIELGGFSEAQAGSTYTTGYGHNAVLAKADAIVGAVKSGAIKRFLLVGGCDGSRSDRYYYTEFVKQAPSDTVILTLGCGKYRFNDLDLGSIGDLPRLLDMGQCNDAYSALKVARALTEALGCEVNDLPLTIVLSWYEQKAVAVLLALLHLGIKNIYLGPTWPAFLSANIKKQLIDNYNLTMISTPEEDLKKICG